MVKKLSVTFDNGEKNEFTISSTDPKNPSELEITQKWMDDKGRITVNIDTLYSALGQYDDLVEHIKFMKND